MSEFNYSFELHEFNEALTSYGIIETRPPDISSLVVDNFVDGIHFRTGPDENGALQLELEDRLITVVMDESGSMTWNDNNGDRYTLFKRLLTKLNETYPGSVTANLIGFGGVPTRTSIFLAQAGDDFLTTTGQNFDAFLQQTFQDSVFDFAGVRVVRRTDRFPTHPADGVVVTESITEAVKDINLVEGQTYYYGIWTFNKDLHFSTGQFVKGFPTDRVLPHGVNLADATPRRLPGVERDDNTTLIYNFAEGSGFLTFDSSGSGYHGIVGTEVIEESFWSGDAASNSHNSGGSLKKPVGVRFDGEFDIVETDISNISDITPSTGQGVTVNLWIFRYASSVEKWVIGTGSNIYTDDIGWAIGVMPDGTVGFASGNIGSGFTSISTTVIPEKTWTMVTVRMSVSGSNIVPEAAIINGQQDSITPSASSPASTANKLYIGAKPIASGTGFDGEDFFGSLHLVSIHNTSRTNQYLSDLYIQESLVFNQSSTQSAQNPVDNRQREVLLNWSVSEDFDFSDGTVSIVRKYKEVPSHPEDGDIILTQDASSGQFFFMDSFDFINNGNYYYRIFTTNALGNVCDRSEARVLYVQIPRSINVPANPLLEPISNGTITEGNHKIYLQWSNPTDSRWKGTRVYFGTNGFPTINVNQDGSIDVSDGTLIIDTVSASFVHRIFSIHDTGSRTPLINGVTHYYTIVTYDKFNRISSASYLSGVPSAQLTTVFPPENVKDLHLEVLNPETLSVQWENPTLKSEQLDLFLGESSLVFVNIKDIFGGDLEDVTNINLQVCTSFVTRKLKTSEQSLGTGGNNPFGTGSDGLTAGGFIANGRRAGSNFRDDCNTEQEEEETVLSYANVESGLVKGLLTHTNDRQVLARRSKYTMDVRAQYKVVDPNDESDTPISLFEFNTDVVRVTFTHPINISIVNKLNKFVDVSPARDGGYRGEDSDCDCPPSSGTTNDTPKTYNGGYARSSQPYVARVEIQYKGESLPNGTPVIARLFKHGVNDGNDNPLTDKSDKTFIREGSYITSSVLVEELDSDGDPTGRLISKSIVDIEIPHPQEEDFVDLYVTLDHLGFFVDAVHEVRFIDTLFIEVDATKPFSDGIDTSEQFATVWSVDPDDPDNPDANIPAPDGTLVRWELVKLEFGKERPFYSNENISQSLSGIYSTTINGVARNVIFGPVGNIEAHHSSKTCGNDTAAEPCCVGEQYAIKANVILGSRSATDAYKLTYNCPDEQEFSNRRFLMNADFSQPLSGGPSQNPHWVTWADGEHMLKFQIAKNPAISSIAGADCFRRCVENEVGGQLFPFPDQHIVQITAPGEILWNVSFDEDPYTGQLTPISFDSISPEVAEDLGIPFVANIPIVAETTDFYIRYNHFVNDANPAPQNCETQGGGGSGGILPCEWRGVCQGEFTCSPVAGVKWDNVGIVRGVSTLISGNKEITLLGGGGYTDGIPPIFVGFREPLNVRVIDARINGQRVNELVVDGSSQHTFTVEVTFAGEAVPDGTPIEVTVTGEDQSIVIISSCINAPEGCQPGSSGTIYTRKVNDVIVNPQNDAGTVPKRSLAYFSIDPLPDVAFNAKINVTCRYDKLGTVTREITKCIELNNTVNVQPPVAPPATGGDENEDVRDAATSNEAIVYDTIRNLYESTRGASQRRMGHFAVGASVATADYMYIFGGLTGNGDSSTQNLTPKSEKFDLQSQMWEFTTDMQTPRAYGQSVIKDDKIYVIGGIELDQMLSQYVVSRKMEMYDIATEMWNTTLSPMPEDNGVAFGNACIEGDFIYVTCGVTEIENSSQPGALNEKILRYSILDDEWTTITPSDLLLYKRLAPFGWYRTQPTSGGKRYYTYSGSVPKPAEQIESERSEILNRQISQLNAFLATSQYFNNLPASEQNDFRDQRTQDILDGTVVAAFNYPATGFKFEPGSETIIDDVLTMDISDTIDGEWGVLPQPRDHGRAVYIPRQDSVYLMGGSNQNQSTTLNRVEVIDFENDNEYSRLTPFNRGRAMFGAVEFNDDIYLSGGLTSGHSPGFVEIVVQPEKQYVEARGTESGGLFITLKNDAGEIINDNIRVDVRGRLRIPEIDAVLTEFLANRGADRALGGTGTGDAVGLPSPGDEIDIERLIEAQNKIIDPNSDDFQFNAARKLNEEVEIFPVLYSSNEFIISSGVGGVTLLPRSEDPLSDLQKLSQFIDTVLQNTPENTDETFTGDLTRDELAALGDALSTVDLPPTIINSKSLRELYTIETKVTILDPVFYGQTVSQFDLDIQEQINQRIFELLTPPEEDPASGGGFGGFGDFLGGGGGQDGGSAVTESKCFLLQHTAQQDVPGQDQGTSPTDTNSPSGVGGFSGSGQCLFCKTIVPTNADVRVQLPTVESVFYNVVDWVPQIKKRLVDGNHSLSEVIEELDIIDREVPFGSSQLYDAMTAASASLSNDSFDLIKKVIYIASDNTQNISITTRDNAIEEVNSIDGEKKVPVIYTVMSTSFPLSLSAQLERSQVGDVEKIVEATRGQATTLIQSGFLDQILNIAIGGATGGLGYGIYTRKLNFDELSAITAMMPMFNLPPNTQGFIRFRSSEDGFNFTDYSERYEGNGVFDFVDFFAKILEFEVVLTTGFTTDITEEYDDSATDTPKLLSLTWEISGEKEDFLFVNKEEVLTNAQQVAMAFEGDVPSNAIVELGVATSNSHDWRDFQSDARPSVREFGKTFLLERTDDPLSLVPIEPLVTLDGKLYTTVYGPWDPKSIATLYQVSSDGDDVPVLNGFVLYPREGQIYFDTKQSPSKQFKLSIVNDNCMRVGVRLRNRLHTQSIGIEGVGYIYSTNDVKPVALSQVPPRAINVQISPRSPSASDTIFALYDFVDLNNNEESGSIISWFKNGMQLLEIQNKLSWTNADLLLKNKLVPNDRISFQVTPNDGRDFGTPVFSPVAIVQPQQPGIDNVNIVPFRNGIVNNRYDTSSTFQLEYDFQTGDEGVAGLEDGTLITWLVNGQIFKQATFSEIDQDPYIDPKSLTPSEVSQGITAHVIGNQIQVEVTPKTALVQGELSKSQLITVENSVALAQNVVVTPEQPGTQSTLQVSYSLDDLDISSFNTQTNQSEIKWLQSPNGANFVEVPELLNSTTVPPVYLRAGEQWKARVTPFDGLDLGPPVDSNVVVISP